MGWGELVNQTIIASPGSMLLPRSTPSSRPLLSSSGHKHCDHTAGGMGGPCGAPGHEAVCTPARRPLEGLAPGAPEGAWQPERSSARVSSGQPAVSMERL